ncbi:MAG: LysM peptidoglycan-binding domain-containing protein, partial [Flavobacterium sp.]|nr:LysM peptidoglycan-binding domain-containing protein [Flavobacterium sp.]
MKKHILAFLFFYQWTVFLAIAQENTSQHTVLKGETVSSIARKYKVTPNDLYQLNAGIFEGIKEGQVILIPESLVKNKLNEVKPATSSSKSTNEIIHHDVQYGETKFGLSRRYGISISELERQNPHIVNMLQAGHQLKITGGVDSNVSNSKKDSTNLSSSTFTTYEVLPGETLYGISRRYGVTVDDLMDANNLIGVLQIGQILRIPTKNSVVKNDEGNQIHLVQAGETKYGLSKKYGVSIEELEQKNPQIIRMLQTGQRILIPGKVRDNRTQKPETEKAVVEIKKTEETLPEKIDVDETEKVTEVVSETPKKEKAIVNITQVKQEESVLDSTKWVDYTIQPKETLYGLSKMTGISQEKLLEINPILLDGVKSGQVIKIPAETVVTDYKPQVSSLETKSKTVIENKSETVGLLKTINKIEKKEIAFLTTFSNEQYTSFIQNPISEPTKEIEFYAGANFAIDSLKKIGLKIEMTTVQIEIGNDAKAEISSVKKSNIEKSKAFIYYSEGINTEKLSDYSNKFGIPFVVTSVEESAQKSATTYVSIPSKNELAKMVLNYIANKNGNLIVVSDAVSALNEDFILQNYPKARFVRISGKEVLEDEAVTKELILNRKNFVLLNTDKIGLILNTTTALLKHSNQYTIQLALLEPKESILKEGLSEMRFKALNTIYPSYSDRNNLNQ